MNLLAELTRQSERDGWRDCKLGDVLELKRGYDLPSQQRLPGSVPIVSSSGPSGLHSEAMVKAPGVVTGRYGTLGEVHFVTRDFWPLNTTLYVRDFKGSDPKFISYFLKTIDFHSCSDKAAVPGVNRNHLHELPVRIPPVTKQQAIARILGALDDKIELNRKMNDTLEAMARALFKSWFVDFDPVRANAEGRAPSGMDAETAKLFPSEFMDSELGPIPKGWPVSKLGDVLELKRGYDLPAALRFPGRVPIVSSSGPTGVHAEAKVTGPGIVTGRYGTIGQVFLVREDFWPLNTTLYVRDLKGTRLYFAYHLLCGLDFGKFSDKAAVPGINRNHVHEERVVAAPQQVQERFEEVVEPWTKQLEQRATESLLLARTRDALLPRLLSGELSVAAAERTASEAV